ncbi:MAG: sterol desaturase family protein [Deltaproteobacteria bacterium]|nr:sterol desaturase family protein [Deltaproteobacteria bacterium]MBW2047577.1 sterol desaturase family protein [Deltaproteobacteria bacterium]
MKNEILIRLLSFACVFILIAVWERIRPRREMTTSRTTRWVGNLGIVGLNSLLAQLVTPVMPVAMALVVRENQWGLLNTINIPYPVAVIVGVVLLDLVIYVQHVMFHALPILWRLHMMHHADLDYDLTTGLRFHPLEILISLGIKLSVVVVLGPPVLAVIVFEVLLNATATFNHGNIHIPEKIDRFLRLLLVTPDMHRVHHSVIIRETNSNFGFNLPWWDRLFGTYRSQPAAGHRGMTIGLSQFRDPKRLTLPWMLALPFVGKPGSYSINGWGREPVAGKKGQGIGET